MVLNEQDILVSVVGSRGQHDLLEAREATYHLKVPLPVD